MRETAPPEAIDDWEPMFLGKEVYFGYDISWIVSSQND